jgi:hypothetical protein
VDDLDASSASPPSTIIIELEEESFRSLSLLASIALLVAVIAIVLVVSSCVA